MSQYKAVVFDLDGTLLDTYRLIFDSFNYSWEFRGIKFSDEEIEARFGPPEPDLIQGVIGDDWREGLERFHEYYEKNHRNLIKLEPYWAEVFVTLRDKGYYIGLFTGKGKTATEITLAQTGLAKYFDSVLSGTEVNKPKPDPEGIVITAQRFKVKPEEMIYIGDTWVDVKAARAAGAKSVLSALYHGPDEKGLKLNPDWVFRKPDDLVLWSRGLTTAEDRMDGAKNSSAGRVV